MQLNYLAIVLATLAQFFTGAIWYSVFFGKLWGKIHGFDKLPKNVQEKMMAQMGPIYGVQFFITLISSFVLALFMAVLPHDWNPWGMAGFFWLGFVMPTTVSGVLFGGAEPKWAQTKIAIQLGASLLCLLVAATVLHFL